MESNYTYYNIILTDLVDSQITSNFFRLSVNSAKDNDNPATACKIQFTINNYKTKLYNTISLTYQNIIQYLKMVKLEFNQFDDLIESIAINNNQQKSFSIQLKKKLMTTLLYKPEYGGTCVRFSILENNNDLSDSDKFFMSISDFLTIINLLKQFEQNYFLTINTILSQIYFQQIHTDILDLNSKLTSFYSELQSHKSYQASSDDVMLPSSSSEKIIDDLSKNSVQHDLDDYINQNRDKIELETEKEVKKPDTSSANKLENIFTKTVLDNDITNIEMYLNNIIDSDNLILDKFCSIISKKINFTDPNVNTFLPNCTISQWNAINYVINQYVKTNIKRSLSENIKLFPNVVPLIYRDAKPNEFNLSLMYELLLYFVYYSLLKSQLQEKDSNIIANKEMISFVLKFVFSPLIFSFIKNIDKKIVLSEVIRRFETFTSENVFKNLEDQIFKKYAIKVNVNSENITKEISKIYDKVIQNYDRLYIDAYMPVYQKNNIIKLDYNVFQKHNLTLEQIIKLILLENNYKKNNGKVVKEEIKSVRDFSDIPDDINKIFEMNQKKYDNTNLLRYVKETFKDDRDLDKLLSICNSINESYYDLRKTQMDLTVLPENFLKAICNWDTKIDSKIQNNYAYYVQKIQKCSLNKTLCIAMLSNLNARKDSNYFESLVSTNN